MTSFNQMPGLFGYDAQVLLYCVQAAAYASALFAIRCGKHACFEVYLASCLVHVGLAALHIASQA